MNFLAHAHLSGENSDLLFGNFIADAVKGDASLRYKNDILAGITLHRKIDSYTDSHRVHKNSRDLIRNRFGKYSGIVVDIFYDHFLAKQWENYSQVPLGEYTSWVYKEVSKRFFLLPYRTKRILPFMISQNWLLNYAHFDGLENVFYGMDRRTRFVSGMQHAVDVLKEQYPHLETDFNTFYPELIKYVASLKKNS
jgi:acyl carrier protein phosphodiesterase